MRHVSSRSGVGQPCELLYTCYLLTYLLTGTPINRKSGLPGGRRRNRRSTASGSDEPNEPAAAAAARYSREIDVNNNAEASSHHRFIERASERATGVTDPHARRLTASAHAHDGYAADLSPHPPPTPHSLNNIVPSCQYGRRTAAAGPPRSV